jgi:hypothetical protein
MAVAGVGFSSCMPGIACVRHQHRHNSSGWNNQLVLNAGFYGEHTLHSFCTWQF